MNTYLYFRTYPGFSDRNLFAGDKEELVRTCYESLRDSLDGVDACAVVNRSTPAYTEFLRSVVPKIHNVDAPCDRGDSVNGRIVFGGVGSFFATYDYILGQPHADDDVILILEDDYLFVEGGLRRWINAIRHFDGFVSPYDPPGRYSRTDDKFAKKTRIESFEGTYWRQIESTTSTVGGRFKYFRKAHFTAKVPRPYYRRFHPGYFLGRELPSVDRIWYRRCHYWLGINLFCPLPSLATHLAQDQLAFGIDWERRFKQLQERAYDRR